MSLKFINNLKSLKCLKLIAHLFLFYCRHYPEDDGRICIPITDLRMANPKPTLTKADGPFKEYFINMHHVGFATTGRWQASVNGIRHVPPVSPPQVKIEIQFKVLHIRI